MGCQSRTLSLYLRWGSGEHLELIQGSGRRVQGTGLRVQGAVFRAGWCQTLLLRGETKSSVFGFRARGSTESAGSSEAHHLRYEPEPRRLGHEPEPQRSGL